MGDRPFSFAKAFDELTPNFLFLNPCLFSSNQDLAQICRPRHDDAYHYSLGIGHVYFHSYSGPQSRAEGSINNDDPLPDVAEESSHGDA
jgi:hypothetical protein